MIRHLTSENAFLFGLCVGMLWVFVWVMLLIYAERRRPR